MDEMTSFTTKVMLAGSVSPFPATVRAWREDDRRVRWEADPLGFTEDRLSGQGHLTGE